MSTTSVLNVLTGKNKRLKVAVTENVDITKTYMALLTNLIVLCNRKGRSTRHVRIGHIELHRFGREAYVRAPIFFGTVPAQGESSLAPRKEFIDYQGSKAARQAALLEENPNLVAALGRLVTVVKNYAAHWKIPYGKLRVDGAIIDKGDNLFMKIVR